MLTQVAVQHKKAYNFHVFTWLTYIRKQSIHALNCVKKLPVITSWKLNGNSSSVADTRLSFVTDMMELKNIQIKWKHTLTLILQVFIFHPTYYFATGCYCSWCQYYQLLIPEIEHTFMNIHLCLSFPERASTHTYSAEGSPRIRTLLFWNQTMSALKFEMAGDVPHTVSRETCARKTPTDHTCVLHYILLIALHCFLNERALRTPFCSVWIFHTNFHHHNNKDHADSNSDYTGLSSDLQCTKLPSNIYWGLSAGSLTAVQFGSFLHYYLWLESFAAPLMHKIVWFLKARV